ncbi:hypothetical protein E2C01_062677 [Portunus trituberculatus]|uniref:Uncharacterized protein n=1 Tax=Portunus trituberculatus TaxID=210409 RepID=A0A5B7HFX2_PORTR|nr:hypothetical protein [Portunus trituberculatus]
MKRPSAIPLKFPEHEVSTEVAPSNIPAPVNWVSSNTPAGSSSGTTRPPIAATPSPGTHSLRPPASWPALTILPSPFV